MDLGTELRAEQADPPGLELPSIAQVFCGYMVHDLTSHGTLEESQGDRLVSRLGLERINAEPGAPRRPGGHASFSSACPSGRPAAELGRSAKETECGCIC